MNVVSKLSEGSFAVKAALLLHGKSSFGSGQDSHAFATLHRVLESPSGGRPELGSGRLVGPDELEQCLSLMGRESGLSFLPGRLLAASSSALVWWREPKAERVWFNCAADAGIGTRTAVTPHPGLVFMVSAGGIRLWAVKGTARPTPETELFQAPYMNVWSDGRLCVGNALMPRGADPSDMDGFEQGFFSSRFTHPNVRQSSDLVRWPKGIFGLWRSLLNGRHKVFPEQALVPARLTVGSLISGSKAQAEGI